MLIDQLALMAGKVLKAIEKCDHITIFWENFQATSKPFNWRLMPWKVDMPIDKYVHTYCHVLENLSDDLAIAKIDPTAMSSSHGISLSFIKFHPGPVKFKFHH